MPEPRIQILPPEVAERIAAGEVVERPASVVKELVENALDAGATRITVETEGGGKTLLRITDDGHGMTPEEVRLALQRHGTSKLRSAEDLFNIQTLGFRGEALPSIAAVSEMEVLTRTADAPEGTRVVIRGGEAQSEAPAAAPVGTTITVQRLFHNVPVREKFLRSDVTEAGQITEWLQRLALSRPDVSFRLVHDGREALLSPGTQDPLNAVVAILGRGVARDLLRLQAESGDVRVTGFVGRPTLTRANRGLQHFYVNGRAVRSPILFRGLDDAFRATMPQKRYPAALLFVELPPDAVDVNVHPAKTEVRFRDEEAIYGAVLRAVTAALRTDAAQSAPGPDLPLEPAWLPEAPPPSLRVAEPAAPPATAEPGGALPFADHAIGGPAGWQPRAYRPEAPRPQEPGFRWSPPAPPEPQARVPVHPQPSTRPYPEAPAQPEPPAIGQLRLLGQVQDLFILAEEGGRLWIIDQHVAHERVLFDRMTAEGRKEPGEPLLIPATLEVDRVQALALEEHAELLADLGFVVEPFGPGQFALRSVPRTLIGRAYETVFRDLVDELVELSRGGQVKLRKEEVAMAAAGRSCKRAVKAGQKLSIHEMEQLLADLREARNPYTCPHGRPVFLTFDQEEVARLFGGRTCG